MLGKSVGPYQILEKLGAGGMGEVFLGHDPRLERRVALKCLTAPATVSGDSHARVLREARAVARLTHPHIAGVYDVIEQDDRTFIVMEYVEGISLAAHLAGGPLPAEDVRRIGRQLASALAAAHAQGVIHRDLKPANIQVMRDGSIKVLDFGVAKLTPARTAMVDTTLEGAAERSFGGNPGTPLYMSPEQLSNAPLDARSDIYSAGVILFLMATGRRPFLEGSAVGLALAMASDTPPRAHTLNPLVPLDLSAAIAKTLQRDPAQRFQSARDLQSALTLAESGTSTRGFESGEIKTASRPAPVWARRWPLAAAAAVLLLIGVSIKPLLNRLSPVAPPPVAVEPGIAVLPLANLSGDPEQEYVADGMTEAVIAELGRVKSLRVLSRRSVMRYKSTVTPVPQIAKELGVGAVITGSVVRTGNQVHVTVALVQPSPERYLWSATYDRNVGDLLTLSSEVARTAVRNMATAVTPQEQEVLARARHVNADAQQAYLMGRYFWNKRTKGDNDRAIQEFKRAIAIDPQTALAYAGLADCFVIAWDNGYVAPEEAYREAKANATRALEIDEGIAEAHASLGAVYSFGLFWSPAEQEFRRALALNPGYATAYQWYALNLSTLGRHTEAVAEARRALELDPLSPLQNVFLGQRLYYAGDYPAAVVQLTRALDLDPNFSFGHDVLGRVYVEQREFAAAVREFERAFKLEPDNFRGELGYGYAVKGDKAAATRLLQEMLAASRVRYVEPKQIAYVYMGLGDRDRALEWLTKAYLASEGVVKDFAIDPRLSPVGGDPRFLALLRKGGLTFNPGRART
ncbi:MAG TPA: protein kinase [Vicinamibacterales bacterium]|nr:protein kinase [Vicinamibacterales bacterium]